MKHITLYIPEGHLNFIEDLVREGLYCSRAEAIRQGIRLLLQEHHKI